MISAKRHFALGPYIKVDPVEITFREGDIVTILEEHTSGWWKGNSIFKIENCRKIGKRSSWIISSL
jgi:hypothetical protein